MEVGGLVVDHILVRICDVDMIPGLPPRFRVPLVRVAATVTQRWIDGWLLAEGLPLRMRLGEQGLAISSSLDSFGLGEIETELMVQGRWLKLVPRRAGPLPLPQLASDLFAGYLPLPELPRGARLAAVQHDAGELTVHLELPGFEGSLTAGLTDRVRKQLRSTGDGEQGER